MKKKNEEVMDMFDNVIKPSEIKVPGTYVLCEYVTQNINPADRLRIIDVWLDARGVARYRDAGHLPELAPNWKDEKWIACGPLTLPEPTGQVK